MMETSAWDKTNIPSSVTSDSTSDNTSTDSSNNNSLLTRIPSNEDAEISKDLQIKILSDKLDFAQKQLEEKDRQLEHYKQLVKTLKDVLADVTGRNRGAAPPVSLSLSSGSIPGGNTSGAAPTSGYTKGRPPPGFGSSESNKSIRGRKTRSFHSDAFGSSFHDHESQQHVLGSHLLSDEEDTSTIANTNINAATSNNNNNNILNANAANASSSDNVISASSMLGSLVSPSGAPEEPTFGTTTPVKRDVDKIASWRRSSDEPFEPATELSATSTTTTSTPSTTSTTTPSSSTTTPGGAAPTTGALRPSGAAPSGKTVTISSNPIMNSPRGLKKSVSHHSLSSFNSGNTSALSHTGSALIDRPLGPRTGSGANPSAPGTGGLKKSPSGGFTLSGDMTSHHGGANPRHGGSILENSELEGGSSTGGVGGNSNKLNKLKKSQSMTSVYTVLEENRLDLKFPELDQMVGQIYALSKYQQGCRFLQKKLDENNAAHTKIILNELVDHLMELMTDPFGNYLFSKLMEHCDESQREAIVAKILQDLLPTAFDMYGTQSMQKMMPFLTESQIDSVINALKPSSIALIKHNKANYLIQYCLDHLPQKHNQWIYDAVAEHMEDVGRDRVGCVIVKRCIDHATSEQTVALFAEICNKALSLVQDPFGNYVVQHVLDKFPQTEQAQRLISRLLGNITELCVQKFSSNVVEKCLQVSDAPNRRAILGEITESDMLPQLLNDRFANFVVQTALDVAEPDDRQKLVKNILPHLGRHYSPYTKRLQKKILQV